MDLNCFIPGTPVPKQSFRYSRSGGYTSERVKAWQENVVVHVRQAAPGIEPTENNVEVAMTFWLPDHRKRDLDNLSKGVLDALNGILWVDDQQVVELRLCKVVCRGRAGVHLRVRDGRPETDE